MADAYVSVGLGLALQSSLVAQAVMWPSRRWSGCPRFGGIGRVAVPAPADETRRACSMADSCVSVELGLGTPVVATCVLRGL